MAGVSFTFDLSDHFQDAINTTNANARAAVNAAGLKGVELTVKQMQGGYGAPIRDTGNLMGSITSNVVSDRAVDVGTNVEYAGYVHEGTYKMRGRPFLKDALTNGAQEIADVWKEYLSRGL